jgi:hypothetical protein
MALVVPTIIVRAHMSNHNALGGKHIADIIQNLLYYGCCGSRLVMEDVQCHAFLRSSERLGAVYEQIDLGF